MARTQTQISDDIKSAYLADPELANAYNFDPAKTFDEQTSISAIERIQIRVVAAAIWALEKLFDAFSTEVDQRLSAQYVTSLQWYHDAALAYQHGDTLSVLSDYRLGYAAIDSSKQLVRFAAVKEVIPVSNATRASLDIKVSKAAKAALTEGELAAFTAYIRQIGAAGMVYNITSQSPESIWFAIQIIRDPLLLPDTDAGKSTICTAISAYLDALSYGGLVYTSGLVSAIMQVPGVIDVRIDSAKVGDDAPVTTPSIESPTGSFVLDETSQKTHITMTV